MISKTYNIKMWALLLAFTFTNAQAAEWVILEKNIDEKNSTKNWEWSIDASSIAYGDGGNYVKAWTKIQFSSLRVSNGSGKLFDQIRSLSYYNCKEKTIKLVTHIEANNIGGKDYKIDFTAPEYEKFVDIENFSEHKDASFACSYKLK